MKSFLAGRTIASVAPLKSISTSPAAPHAGASARAHAGGDAPHSEMHTEAQVECVKQGDKVVRLIVTCSCGERIEIDCVYPTGS